jgi:hypothetical protein
MGFDERVDHGTALMFAAEVGDAASREARGLREPEPVHPLERALEDLRWGWRWSDGRLDVEQITSSALHALARHLVLRCWLSPFSYEVDPAGHWPDLDERLGRLADALEFAARATEVRAIELDEILLRWVQDRVGSLRAPVGGLRELAERVRTYVLLVHRYMDVRRELFADRQDRRDGQAEPPWWCPGEDLAARAPYLRSLPGTPAYVLRLDIPSGGGGDGEVRGTFTPTRRRRPPPVEYRVRLAGGRLDMPDELAEDPICGPQVARAFRALGHHAITPAPNETTETTETTGVSCTHCEDEDDAP